MAESIDWARVAEQFWGARFEEERIAGLKSKDFKTNYHWRTLRPESYGYYRKTDCERAAQRIDNLWRCLREAGMLAMLDSRYRR